MIAFVVLTPADTMHQLIRELAMALESRSKDYIRLYPPRAVITRVLLCPENQDDVFDLTEFHSLRMPLNCDIIIHASVPVLNLFLFSFFCSLLNNSKQAKQYRDRIHEEIRKVLSKFPLPSKYLGDNPLVYEGL